MAHSAEERSIVMEAVRCGLLDPNDTPTYFPPRYCTPLSLLLVPFTLGFSLLFVPILWVAQHEITGQRMARLREKLQRQQQALEPADEDQPMAMGRVPN
ncbi:hypothetical protein [Cyanobium sp. Morenito 9A2]|uniref:hypothetical protein n=1 Tax=Cyanobium sp. Morenito 9A2 TaxID=2823718 RepID=UPI0020CF1193|nr:hypothetical protein [Cyanobium sp. Morenito 9A2]MCP9848471.1 hypothetical protein [Cyanobium sp. Morenito 9A2]